MAGDRRIVQLGDGTQIDITNDGGYFNEDSWSAPSSTPRNSPSPARTGRRLHHGSGPASSGERSRREGPVELQAESSGGVNNLPVALLTSRQMEISEVGWIRPIPLNPKP